MEALALFSMHLAHAIASPRDSDYYFTENHEKSKDTVMLTLLYLYSSRDFRYPTLLLDIVWAGIHISEMPCYAMPYHAIPCRANCDM